MSQRIILASTSPYRRELMQRLLLPFETAAPDVDESPLCDEAPIETAKRLAESKARAVSRQFQDALIIGSDQVAAAENRTFGKPMTHHNAISQLKQMRGKEVIFHTALSLLNSATQRISTQVVSTRVGFRELTDAEIEIYLSKENALNCAGSAKSEGLGISLLSYIRGDDPNALIGLPLIALCEMLRAEGVCIP